MVKPPLPELSRPMFSPRRWPEDSNPHREKTTLYVLIQGCTGRQDGSGSNDLSSAAALAVCGPRFFS
jgi:hypothetical protein